MDFSKLPKLSDTKSQTPPPTPLSAEPGDDHNTRFAAARSPVTGIAETWLSIGVGLFLLLFYPRFLQWASSRVFHTHFDEFVNDAGDIVPYQTLAEFWSDLGITLLGMVLIIDGLLLFTRRRILILLALVITLVSTAFNLIYVILSFQKYGLAPISLLGVLFGGFIISTQWFAYRSSPLKIPD